MEKVNSGFPNASSLLESLATDNGFELVAPIDVDRIAGMLGIAVEEDLSLDDKDIIGEILFREEQPVVRINPIQNMYGPRRRFTLAHEIGHFCLHSATTKSGFVDSQKTMSRTESYWDRKESEANVFAAQLLMPKSLVLSEGKAAIEKYKKDNQVNAVPLSSFIDLMADKFQVSSKAMEYRLKNLGIARQSKSTTQESGSN